MPPGRVEPPCPAPYCWLIAAGEVMEYSSRFELPKTLPWLTNTFASTDDALAAAFAAADPVEAARRLKLRDYRAARKLALQKRNA
tara:strand:+ start:126 stop:380 length:255 start_codon:yes stop_codon:yes gene_type:complete